MLEKKEKKEKNVVLKTTKTQVFLSVPAYKTDPLRLVGHVKVTVWAETEEGLKAAREAYSMDSLKDSNRQKVTDAKNDLRRLGDFQEILAKVKAGTATLDELMKAIKNLTKDAPSGELAKQIQTLLATALKA